MFYEYKLCHSKSVFSHKNSSKAWPFWLSNAVKHCFLCGLCLSYCSWSSINPPRSSCVITPCFEFFFSRQDDIYKYELISTNLSRNSFSILAINAVDSYMSKMMTELNLVFGILNSQSNFSFTLKISCTNEMIIDTAECH